jgi:hypothetical protein
MNASYPHIEVRQVRGWVSLMLLPAVLMTVVGLGHALYSYALLTGLLPDLPLAHLAHALRRTVQRDGLLHSLQLGLALVFVCSFGACWLFLVLRNQAVLRDCRRDSRGAYRRLPAMLALVLPSAPLAGTTLQGAPARALVPLWWGLLVGVAACTLLGTLQLRHPVTVGDWRLAYYWLLAAYALSLAFFVLTRRLGQHLDALQRAYWQYRDATGSAPVRHAAPLHLS